MFGFFGGGIFGSSKKDEPAIKQPPVIVEYRTVDERVKADCVKLIEIGKATDPTNKDPRSFSYDPTGRSSLAYALIEVPHFSGTRKYGDRPKYIGTDICIEAIVLCTKKVYPTFVVAEDHLVRLGYRYASK